MKSLFSFIILSILIMLSGCVVEEQGFHLADFQDPPETAGIYTWWHWMDKAITREGISRDLESMKEQGIIAATILNIGLFDGQDFGVPQVPFDSPEWYDMFRFALEEAGRLGIELGIHNCDGWSTSGGPWITPENSMKQYIWRLTPVKGGEQLSLRLKEPMGRMDYYRDVAVFAYPSPYNNSQGDAVPEVIINQETDGIALCDGEPMSYLEISTGDRIDFTFSDAVTIEKAAIHPHMIFQWGPYNLKSVFDIEVSENGKTYHRHASMQVTDLNQTAYHSFTAATAKYFRVVPREINGLGDRDMVPISEIVLLGKEEVPRYHPTISNHLEKTVALRPLTMAQMMEVGPGQVNALAIDPETVIDLSSMMSEDGQLEWDAPEGNWDLIRFGYTTTGSVNAPATEEGRGLECDKMDTNALNLHFERFPAKLIDAAGDLAGNTFKYFFIDSWECKYQNWTEDLPGEFERRRGYSMLPYMPVLCGGVVESSEKTEAFLNDYRLTIADMIEEYYFKHYSELCRRNNMELHAEVIYGGVVYPPLDVLRSNTYADLPMTEFWARKFERGPLDRTKVEYSPLAQISATNPTQARAVYGMPVLASEAYTGFAHYSETPWDLKPYGDMAFTEGVNLMVLHSYVHQPFEKKPGFTLGQWGSHFNRHNPWWQHFNQFSGYLARQQYILQQGLSHADICYFIGNRMPDFQGKDPLYQLPYGYKAHHVNPDLFVNELVMNNGKLVLPGRGQYSLLILPDDDVFSVESLQKLEKLVSAGAIVVGPRPSRVPSLNGYETELSALEILAAKLWGDIDGKTVFENEFGKGKIIWGKSIETILDEEGILPDINHNDPDSEIIRFIHKRKGAQDIYYLFNQSLEEKSLEFLFHIEDKIPAIYHPQEGTIDKCKVLISEGSQTRIPIHFRPRQSCFVVFSGGIPEESIISVSEGGNSLFPVEAGSVVPGALPSVSMRADGIIDVMSAQGGQYTFMTNLGHTFELDIPSSESLTIRDFSGSITFNPDGEPGSETRTIEIDRLDSYTEYEDPNIKYFSGTAEYEIRFDLPAEWVEEDHDYILLAGETGASAEVWLNGVLLDVVWEPDYPLLLETPPEKGMNVLEIRTSNIWRNSLIGDLAGIRPQEDLWTTSPLNQYMNRDSELFPAGVRGPVKIIKYSPAEISLH